MILGTLLLWAGCAVFPVAQPAPAELHLTLRSEFEYMSMVRPATQEWWFGDKRHRMTQGDRTTIVRDDLGVTWRINTKAASYTEARREAAPAPARSAAPAAIDMHTAGWDWEPDYEWAVTETGNRSTVAGRGCREFVATGEADYAEARVVFWGCDPLGGATRSPNDALLQGLRSESTQKMILKEAAARGGLWILQVEERQEPPIAPTLIVRARVESLEAAAAPPGAFDLPANLTKAGR